MKIGREVAHCGRRWKVTFDNGAECNRCGACCILPDGSDCKYLYRKEDGKTFCRIYSRRLGAEIGLDCNCVKVSTVFIVHAHGPICSMEKWEEIPK